MKKKNAKQVAHPEAVVMEKQKQAQTDLFFPSPAVWQSVKKPAQILAPGNYIDLIHFYVTTVRSLNQVINSHD